MPGHRVETILYSRPETRVLDRVIENREAQAWQKLGRAGTIRTIPALKPLSLNRSSLILGVIDAVAKAGEGVPNTLVQAISTFVDNAVTALKAPETK